MKSFVTKLRRDERAKKSFTQFKDCVMRAKTEAELICIDDALNKRRDDESYAACAGRLMCEDLFLQATIYKMMAVKEREIASGLLDRGVACS